MSLKHSSDEDITSASPTRRRVLGRGLDSLFPAVSTQSQKNSESTAVLFLGIEQIQPSPHQPRRIFDKELLEELANSIKKNGLIQPVIVRKAGLKYEIIAGERRWRAAAQAGLHEIPVRVLEQNQNNPFLALVENLQRQDLNPIELAQAYKKLMQEYKFTQEKLADQLGIPRASLANQLRILRLPLEVQELILKGRLSFALAKMLLQETDTSSQVEWAKYFVKNKIGVREAQKLLSQGRSKKVAGKARQIKSWQSQAMNKIQDIHGVKSALRFKKKGGELCLRFFSDEELHHLMDVLIRQN